MMILMEGGGEVSAVCVRASLPVAELTLPKLTVEGRPGDAVKGELRAYSGGARAFVAHAVYDRYQLAAGAEIEGPAIFEERESTVIIDAGARARVDEYGFLWITLPTRGSP